MSTILLVDDVVLSNSIMETARAVPGVCRALLKRSCSPWLLAGVIDQILAAQTRPGAREELPQPCLPAGNAAGPLPRIDGIQGREYSGSMAILTLELPAHEQQRAFNLRRWAQLLADRDLARIEGRIETDRFGRIIMSPPPAPAHGAFQAEIARLLGNLTAQGRVLTECPISTADGVKAADVAWASPGCLGKLGKKLCFSDAPEICVEVLSPSNTEPEMREKTRLYFDAGAKEVWICGLDGAMTFLVPTDAPPRDRSPLCPRFPSRVRVR